MSFRREEDTNNMLLNLANVVHDSQESERKNINDPVMPLIWTFI